MDYIGSSELDAEDNFEESSRLALVPDLNCSAATSPLHISNNSQQYYGAFCNRNNTNRNLQATIRTCPPCERALLSGAQSGLTLSLHELLEPRDHSRAAEY